MKISFAAVLIASLLAGCATQTPALPDTALGRVAAEWLDAVNSGSSGSVERFVNTRYSAAALRDESAADRVRRLRKLQVQSGGVDLVEVTPAEGERPMTMLVRSRRGNRYATVIMGLDRREEGRLAGSAIQLSDPPAAERAKRWPSTPGSEAQLVEAVRREIDRRTHEGTFSGVVLIGRGDEILLHEARGWADRDARIRNHPDTKFHLASVGKMFTAAAIAQLVDAGKLSFDSKIIDVLPDYPNREIAEKVSVQHLLTHTSGLGTFFGSPGFVPGRAYATALEQLDVFKDEPLFFEPGSRWRYSNAGYAVLQAIIERVTGQAYLDYLREHLFVPFGMNATYTGTSDASVFYRQSDDDPLGMEPFVADRSLNSGVPTGFGGGYSTAGDLFRFARALETMPEIRGLQERTINGATVRGHSGGGRADVQMISIGDYTVIVLTNASPPPANAFGTEIVEFITASTCRSRPDACRSTS